MHTTNLVLIYIIESRHEKMCITVYVSSVDLGQPAHPRQLTRTFVGGCTANCKML